MLENEASQTKVSPKWGIWIPIFLLVAGFVGYFLAPAQPNYLKPIIMAVGFLLSAIVFAISPTGKDLIAFSNDATKEAKKVVWPTRREVFQMTGVVFLFVLIVTIFLWLIDMVLNSIIKAIV